MLKYTQKFTCNCILNHFYLKIVKICNITLQHLKGLKHNKVSSQTTIKIRSLTYSILYTEWSDV